MPEEDAGNWTEVLCKSRHALNHRAAAPTSLNTVSRDILVYPEAPGPHIFLGTCMTLRPQALMESELESGTFLKGDVHRFAHLHIFCFHDGKIRHNFSSFLIGILN